MSAPSASPELKHSSDGHVPELTQNRGVPPAPRSRRSRARLIGATIASLVVVLGLALGLGLGLGLGLKHKHPTSVSSSALGPTSDQQHVATPDASAAFLSMDMVNEAPMTRTYDFVVEERMGAPDGVEKRMLVVNGQYPGPTIEANAGDRLIVNVTNKMSNATAIHWHGLYQRGTNYYDGSMAITQCGIPPNESMVYNFTFDGYVGSTWWHAHAGTQYTDGISGALIVHGQNEYVPKYDGDLVIQVADLYHGQSSELLNFYFTPGGIDGTPGNEPVPDGGTINGVGQYGSANTSFFNATLESDKTYRLRIVNTGSFVAMEVSIDGHTLTIIEADGTAVEPIEVSSLSVAVAQRYSVLLRTNQTAGAYWIRAALDQDAFTYDNPGVQTEIRGIIRYGQGVDPHAVPDVALLDNPPSLPDGAPGDLDTTNLVPVGASPVPDSTFSVYFTISMQQSLGPNTQFLSFINSTSWEPLQNAATLFLHLGNDTTDGSATLADSQLVTTVNEVHVIDMIIDNLDDGDHPFHLHGQKFWIMGSGAGRYQHQPLNNTAPMLRDTLVIPAYTYTILRFVGDNPGFWVFHCHIQWHMAAGLLFQFNILPSESLKFDIPEYMIQQCRVT